MQSTSPVDQVSVIKAFAATLLAFVLIDGAWITFVAVPLFQRELGSLMRADPLLWPAAIFYLIYAAAVTLLVVLPSAREGRLAAAAWRGALLGLAAYGTFDLTNLAIVKGWTLLAALVDLGWGTVATVLAGSMGFWASRRRTASR
ncbi:MAG: DUF2177 family protein [Hyphomicrobiales bacterium]|nr:MAG: DUF2177 family protein [Hyphomicrobiales bacterium]